MGRVCGEGGAEGRGAVGRGGGQGCGEGVRRADSDGGVGGVRGLSGWAAQGMTEPDSFTESGCCAAGPGTAVLWVTALGQNTAISRLLKTPFRPSCMDGNLHPPTHSPIQPHCIRTRCRCWPSTTPPPRPLDTCCGRRTGYVRRVGCAVVATLRLP